MNPAGAGSVPATVTVLEGELTAIFDYVDASALPSADVTATLGASSDVVTLTIVPPSGHLVINEVDYDQVSTDTAEFVEVLNPTAGSINLAGKTLYLVNGNGNAVYKTVDLTPAGILVCGAISGGHRPGGSRGRAVHREDLGLWRHQQHHSERTARWNCLGGYGRQQAGRRDLLRRGNDPGDDSGSGPRVAGGGNGHHPRRQQQHARLALCRMPNGTDTDDAASDWAFCVTPTPGAANVP